MVNKFKQAPFFIGLNSIVLIEVLLTIRGRFYLRTQGVSDFPLAITIFIFVLSTFLILFGLKIARSLTVNETSLDQAKPKLIIMSILFGSGLSGILLAIEEILKLL